MKHTHRFAALILALLLLTSCGSAEVTSETTAGDNGSVDTVPEETETRAEYISPDVTYDGAEFCILDYQTDDYFWQAATYSDIHADPDTGEPINDAQYKRNLTVEEELDIALTTYPVGGVARGDNAKVFRDLVMADEDTIDAGFVFGTIVKTLLAEPNLLQDIRSIPTMNPEASWWEAASVETFTLGGELKMITGDVSLYTTFSPILYFFNKEVAAENNITDCYDLVREGKWTLDKMIEYCTLVSSDLNGDGIMDQNDRYGIAHQRSLLNDMIFAADQRFVMPDDKGNQQVVANCERMINIVEKCVPFLNNKDITIAANDYTSKYSNVFYEQHIPMFQNNQLLFNFQQILISFELREMESDYGLMPQPKYDEAQEKYVTSISHSWATLLCIPATNRIPEMTGQVLDALGYYSQLYVTPAFIDTTVRHKSLRDEDSEEMLEIILASKVYDIAMMYNWGNLYSNIQNLGVSNNTGFASVYAKMESAVLTDMEKALAQLEG
ncbi:MAG: hypothetical protein IJB52_09095 [Clostridia bacterium]|nr:hypothetical protein [Clostridia bacterium]